MPPRPRPAGTASALALAALLGAAGVTHLRRPDLYDRLIPRWLGPPRPWVLGSGVAELACAAAVAHPATRRTGALATAALFVAVFPGNVQMALDARPGARSPARRPAVAWGRLPLQVPLVMWAWRTAAAVHRTVGESPSPGGVDLPRGVGAAH
ncbi:MauE/DoxX family redox-associated membrane protein [uncultured Cellulomonas sp.]|uniref:DoxX family protein n=1 Tax=uncultured Cellulomonas sp. TaxID=189682 RepID=UPI00260ED018|nr:MauE/DoxX family redox-associated membrane protein [uncultured Cellulomonas sp.]